MQEFKQDTKQIVGYTLGEYTEEVQKAIAEGYTMSSDNEKYPYHFGGGGYYATFVITQAIPEAPIAVPVEIPVEVLSEAPIVDSINENVEQNKKQNNDLDNQPETTVKSNRQSRRAKQSKATND